MYILLKIIKYSFLNLFKLLLYMCVPGVCIFLIKGVNWFKKSSVIAIILNYLRLSSFCHIGVDHRVALQ